MPSVLDQIRIVNGQVWDAGTLSWVPMTQPLISGGSVTISGSVAAVETRPTTGTTTTVAGSASSVTLLASNTNRRGASIYNDSTADLYLKLGASASLTSFTERLGPDERYELPFPAYTGVIDGIWANATGNARITELT